MSVRRGAWGLVVAAVLAAPAPAQDPVASPPCRPHHLRLYLYTSPHVRPRHQAVVTKALERRAQVHSSGFAEQNGAPQLELGPVRDRVFHWRWRDGAWDRNTSMPVAWPFVAVLEYDGRGEPRAWIDWFRRPKGSQDGGAWTRDPSDQRYAQHIGDAYTTAHDDQYAYLAIVDTPTGGVVFGNEWVVRGRVHWDSGQTRKRAGVQVWFDRRGADLDDWVAVQTPLVGWVPLPSAGRRRAAKGSVPVEHPEEQLAVFGTNTVFTLPPIPDGVVPARGFPAGAPDSPGGGVEVSDPGATPRSADPDSPPPGTRR